MVLKMLAPLAAPVVEQQVWAMTHYRPYLIQSCSRREVSFRLPQGRHPCNGAAAERADKVPEGVPSIQHAAQVLDELRL